MNESANGLPRTIPDLYQIILDYESDTFSAQAEGVTAAEARSMAALLEERFVRVVQEGGIFISDGIVLSDLLEQIREGVDPVHPCKRPLLNDYLPDS